MMGGLTQWFQADRGERGLDGVGVTAGCTQSPGQALKCVQPYLAQPFSLVLHPVVIPVRQQVPDQVGQTYRIQVNSFGGGPRLVEAACECNQIADINFDAVIEPEEAMGLRRSPARWMVDPPQRGPQVGERAFCRIVRPERSGHMKPPDRAILQGEQRDQALTARGNPEFLAAPPERKPSD